MAGLQLTIRTARALWQPLEDPPHDAAFSEALACCAIHLDYHQVARRNPFAWTARIRMSDQSELRPVWGPRGRIEGQEGVNQRTKVTAIGASYK